MYLTEQENKQHRIPENSTPWCNQVSNDFCPLVISMMGFICLISIILIIYLCLRGTVECTKIRDFFHFIRLKIFPRILNESARLTYGRSMNLSDPIDRSFIYRVNNYTLPNHQSQIWFTDISKNVAPPPTYDESQFHTLHHAIKPKPIIPATAHTPSSVTHINDIQETVFPNIRCLTLTSSDEARSTLNRLGNLSHNLLVQNAISREIIHSNFRSSRLTNDEVPPAYETIVSDDDYTSTYQENKFISNEFLV